MPVSTSESSTRGSPACIMRPEATFVSCRLTMGVRSEKCVVRRFRRCANVIESTYTNLDSIAYCRYASIKDGNTF
jgi:hypothetical protein